MRIIVSNIWTLIFTVSFISTGTVTASQNNLFPSPQISEEKWTNLKTAISEVKLNSDDGGSFHQFGISVSVSGDRALIGAYGDDTQGDDAGAAYVFEYFSGAWQQTAKLTADDGAFRDYFGYAVHLSGDSAIIGAYRDDDNGSDSGSAYIFEYKLGSWSQVKKLTAPNGNAFDNFGQSVSITNDRALVGAVFGDGNVNDTGIAYVFESNGGLWDQSTNLTASDGIAGDWFGYSVSISNDRALIGSPKDSGQGIDAGSAYVYDFINDSWVETTEITSSDASASDGFGFAVSLLGDRALISAYKDGDQGFESGSAYVFEYTNTWNQTQKLLADDGTSNNWFGYSVSLTDDRALIGARLDGTQGAAAGSAYVFDYTGNNWEQNDKLLASDGDTNDNYGISVSVSNDHALVGAYYDIVDGTRTGSAYMMNIIKSYDISVNVTGLATNNQVELLNNSGDNLLVTSDGVLTFNTAIDTGESYDITVNAQPTSPNQTCDVINPSGTVNEADVQVEVVCSTNSYSVSGSVTGLASDNSVTLSINAGSQYLVVDTASFTFNEALLDGTPYQVTVFTNPTTPNQTCSVIDGSGVINGSSDSDTVIECQTNQYFIGGYAIDLIPDNNLVLQNNLGNDLLVSDSGAFVFSTPMTDFDAYDVSILNQPTDPIQSCEVLNESGNTNGTDVINVLIDCIFGDDLIFRHDFDSPIGISAELWELDESDQ